MALRRRHTCKRASWPLAGLCSCSHGADTCGCPPPQILRQLRQLAAQQRALSVGQVAAVQEATVQQGPDQELHALAVSPSGTRVIAKHNGSLVLSGISRGPSPSGALLIREEWTNPAPAPPPPWG